MSSKATPLRVWCLALTVVACACSYDFERFVSEAPPEAPRPASGGGDSGEGGEGFGNPSGVGGSTGSGGLSAAGAHSAGGRVSSHGSEPDTGGAPGGADGGAAAAGEPGLGGAPPGGGAPAGTASTLGGVSGAASAGGTSVGGTSVGGTSVGGTSVGGTSAGDTSMGGALSSGGTPASGGALGHSGGAAAATCEGAEFGGVCWYLSESNESCAEACAVHGGASPAAESFVGVAAQGGSAEECREVLALLGINGSLSQGTRTDGLGLGCHVRTERNGRISRSWLSSPAYSAAAREAASRLACGCVR